MGRTCIDVDHELEKEIGNISTYITEQGEPAFREKKRKWLQNSVPKQVLLFPLAAAV